MGLGETIYRLRKEKQFSQGDLAEMLEVSRQSVSKWENDSAVPDLDKLVKLGEIFGISLDELVKGETSDKFSDKMVDDIIDNKDDRGDNRQNISVGKECSKIKSKDDREDSRHDIRDNKNNIIDYTIDVRDSKNNIMDYMTVVSEETTNFHQGNIDTGSAVHTSSTRFIVGAILISAGVISGLMLTYMGGNISLIYALPFFLCGMACLIFKRNTRLWCIWALYLSVDMYMRVTGGIIRGLALKSGQAGFNATTVIVVLILLVSLAVLIGLTVVRLPRKNFDSTRKAVGTLVTAWVVYILVLLFCQMFPKTDVYMRLFTEEVERGMTRHNNGIIWYLFFVEGVRVVTFAMAVVSTARVIMGRMMYLGREKEVGT